MTLLDTRPVVPTAIEDHKLWGCGQLRHVPLEVPASPLTVRRSAECHSPRAAGAEVFDDVLDDVVLAGGIPAFDDDKYLVTAGDDMPLEFDEFDLQQAHLRRVLMIRNRLANGPRDPTRGLESGCRTKGAGRVWLRVMFTHVLVHELSRYIERNGACEGTCDE